MTLDAVAPAVAGLRGPANVLVTGASSGIGHAMLRGLLENPHVDAVFAVSRSASSNNALQALRGSHGDRLLCIDADLTHAPDLAALTQAVAAIDALHLVVNAAGMLHADGIAPERSLDQVDALTLHRVFALNAFAPILLAQALLPKLCRGQPAVFASLSARVGSIGDNRVGGWYAYRASKAAQNQLMKTFSIEWRRRNPLGTCLLLHPGTVATPLSGPFRSRIPLERVFDAATAAARLLGLIAACTPADSGRFLAWDGTEIPW